MNVTENELKAFILNKLARRKCWGGKHTSFDNLQKGAPPYIRNEIKKIGKQLIKDGFLMRKPTSYGLEVSLNPRMKNKIYKIISSM